MTLQGRWIFDALVEMEWISNPQIEFFRNWFYPCMYKAMIINQCQQGESMLNQNINMENNIMD